MYPPEYAAFSRLSFCQHHSHEAPFFSRFDGLGINDAGSGLDFLPQLFSEPAPQGVMDAFPGTVVLPLGEIVIDDVPFGEVMGEHAPVAT